MAATGMHMQITARTFCDARPRPSNLTTTEQRCSCPSRAFGVRRPWTKRHAHLTVVAAKKQQIPQETKRWSLLDLLPKKKAKPAPPPPPPEWNVLDWKQYNQAWEVPWGRKELFLGLFAWAGSFVAVGLVFVPLLGYAAGIQDFKTLTSQDKSYLALLNQVTETLVGLSVINATVRLSAGRDKDREAFDDELDELEIFKLNLRKPFSKPYGWLFWGLIGVVAAPIVVGTCATIVSAVGYEDLVTDKRGTVDGVTQLLSTDIGTFASLFAVTAILAPLLEEVVFRGFLLTSLTKFMPTWLAVLISSLGFGLAHASARDLPQLAALGTLLGFSYVRSRNLLTPMLIHGAWNGTVLLVLFALASSGVDLSEALSATQTLSQHFITQHTLLP